MDEGADGRREGNPVISCHSKIIAHVLHGRAPVMHDLLTSYGYEFCFVRPIACGLVRGLKQLV